MTLGALRLPVAVSSRAPDDRALPAWPVAGLLWGFPVWWLTGLLPFVPLLAFVGMGAILLSRRRDVDLPPGGLPLLAFLLWLIPCAVMISEPSGYLAYGMRVGTLYGLGVMFLYIMNARENLRQEHLFGGVLVIWATTVVGGNLALVFPDARLTTPVGLLMPASIAQNELVENLLFPPLAEVQQPWGAEEPFNRPSAPYPYTNGWGSAFALTTPVVVAAWLQTRRTSLRIGIPLGFAAAVMPAIATSNRGMFLILGVIGAFTLVRLIGLGRVRDVAVLAVCGVVAGALLVGLGVLDGIADRQEVSDTTSGRAGIYEATLAEVAKSPVLGYGAPRPSDELGISLGTQGTVWMYVFSYGIVGLLLFLCFLVSAVLGTWTLVQDAPSALLQACLVGAVAGSFFYGFDYPQWSVILVALSLLLRRSREWSPHLSSRSPRAAEYA